MNPIEILVVVTFVICMLMLYHKIKFRNRIYVRSDIDEHYYMVRDCKDKRNAANMLALIRKHLRNIITFIMDKIRHSNEKDECVNYKQYVNTLNNKYQRIIFTESPEDSMYTSYCVNKGDEIVFCLRSRTTNGSLHDINLVMYVALHEISHIACPEQDHTPLFKQIFNFICRNAIESGIYKKINFAMDPTEYCGMTIFESIV